MRCRYGLAEPLRREQELSSVRAGDGMGFTAFRTEKSVSEEILRGEEAEVGGWEGVFGSGELRSFLGFGGGGLWVCFGGGRWFRFWAYYYSVLSLGSRWFLFLDGLFSFLGREVGGGHVRRGFVRGRGMDRGVWDGFHGGC
jgi:hypothetical protein